MKQFENKAHQVKVGLAEMLKGGVIMDVTTAEQAVIAEEAGAVAVMALERVPADIRATAKAQIARGRVNFDFCNMMISYPDCPHLYAQVDREGIGPSRGCDHSIPGGVDRHQHGSRMAFGTQR